MSAQNNHKRFQRKGVTHIPAVSEIKDYQKDLRKKTFKAFVTTCAAILLIITVPIIFKNRFAHSKGYQWIQTSWLGGVSTSLLATASGWTNYWNVVPAPGTGTGAVKADQNGVTLTNVSSNSVGETGGTYSGSLTNGSGMYKSNADGTYNASGNSLTLKKPQGASCSNVAQCAGASPTCTSNICCQDACCGTSSISDANGTTYGTVVIGTQCWMNSNMRSPKEPNSLIFTNGGALNLGTDYYCYTGDNSCATASGGVKDPNYYYGALYTWHAAMNVLSSYDGSLLNPGTNYEGICPIGWHIPADPEWDTLINSLGGSSIAGTPMMSGGTSGFNAPLAGFYNGSGYYNRGVNAYFWSATEYNSGSAWYRYLSSGNASVYRNYIYYNKPYGYSVRCLKN